MEKTNNRKTKMVNRIVQLFVGKTRSQINEAVDPLFVKINKGIIRSTKSHHTCHNLRYLYDFISQILPVGMIFFFESTQGFFCYWKK